MLGERSKQYNRNPCHHVDNLDETGNLKKKKQKQTNPLYNETHMDTYLGGKKKQGKKYKDYRGEFSMIRECLSDAVIFEQRFE